MRILAVLVYVGFIFTLSTWRNPPSGPPIPYLDKIVHTVEYGILGLLLAWNAGDRWQGWRRLVVLLVAGLAVGAADETIQRRTPGRQSSVRDLCADLTGVSLAWSVGELRSRGGRRRGGGD